MNYLTAKEWALCLANPQRKTWLRITEEREREVLETLKTVVIVLWVLANLAGMFMTYRIGEYMQAKRMVNQGWLPTSSVQINQT